MGRVSRGGAEARRGRRGRRDGGWVRGERRGQLTCPFILPKNGFPYPYGHNLLFESLAGAKASPRRKIGQFLGSPPTHQPPAPFLLFSSDG